MGVYTIEILKNNKWKNIVCLNLFKKIIYLGGNGINNDKKTVETLHVYFPKMKYLYL